MRRYLRHFISLTILLTVIISSIPSLRVYTGNLSSYRHYISNSTSSPWYYTVNFTEGQIYVAVKDSSAQGISRMLIRIDEKESHANFFLNGVSSITEDISDLKDGIHLVTLFQGENGIFHSKANFYINKEGNHVFLYSPYCLSNNNWLANYKKKNDFTIDSFISNKAYQPIIQKSIELTTGCQTKEEKLRAIHDYICSNISYDYQAADDALNTTVADPVWVFDNKRGVCSGISHLAQIMLISVGIYSELVQGYSYNPSSNDFRIPSITDTDIEINHEWNMVYLDDSWKFVDFTWDNNNKYFGERNPNNLIGQAPSYNYYLSSTEFYSMDHLYLDKCNL